jgi:hypothetical protein
MVERTSHCLLTRTVSDPRPDYFQRLAGAGNSDATNTPRSSPRAVLSLPSTHTSVTFPPPQLIVFSSPSRILCVDILKCVLQLYPSPVSLCTTCSILARAIASLPWHVLAPPPRKGSAFVPFRGPTPRTSGAPLGFGHFWILLLCMSVL